MLLGMCSSRVLMRGDALATASAVSVNFPIIEKGRVIRFDAQRTMRWLAKSVPRCGAAIKIACRT